MKWVPGWEWEPYAPQKATAQERVDEGGQCVEIAAHPAAVHVRDSEDIEGPAFTVAPAAWSAFAAYAATA
ncbi:DUF397 domain-containing protein [Streptomyces anulatus]|nr:DUF397 domain-containing protein [Streptomyces anulatus]WTD27300.1 DUF397 domain-containing protein [Streptomyces anulatus]